MGSTRRTCDESHCPFPLTVETPFVLSALAMPFSDVSPVARKAVMTVPRQFAKDPAIRKLKLHLAEPYDNSHPAPPSPNVDHFVENDRLDLAVAEVAFVNARTAREFFEGDLFRKTLSQQGRYLDAIGAYLVTGFYTFVRDGKPTPAGLRGSRQAELIDAVGATNQLDPAVAGLFLREKNGLIYESRGV